MDMLQQMLDDLESLLENKRVIMLKRREPEPERPLVIESQKDWDAYCLAVHNWRMDSMQLDGELSKADMAYREQQNKIVEYIPANTWFKTRTCYVGYQTSNWPMDTPTLRFVNVGEEPPVLKHLIIRD